MRLRFHVNIPGQCEVPEDNTWRVMRFSRGGVRISIVEPTDLDMKLIIEKVVDPNKGITSLDFSLGFEGNHFVASDEIDYFALLADHTQMFCKDQERFCPQFPAPCMGVVPDRHSIKVLERPKGHIASVSIDHTIYSEACFNVLREISMPHKTEVLWRDTIVKNWCRLSGESAKFKRAEQTLRKMSCQLCKQDAEARMTGAWISSGKQQGDVFFNSFPNFHAAYSEGIVVSRRVAETMESRLGKKGLAFTPILNHDSPTALRILKIINQFADRGLWPF